MPSENASRALVRYGRLQKCSSPLREVYSVSQCYQFAMRGTCLSMQPIVMTQQSIFFAAIEVSYNRTQSQSLLVSVA